MMKVNETISEKTLIDPPKRVLLLASSREQVVNARRTHLTPQVQHFWRLDSQTLNTEAWYYASREGLL